MSLKIAILSLINYDCFNLKNMDLIESNKIELKSKFSDQIVKEIVAFLNTDGGQIFIGVSDDGKKIGAQEIDKTLRNISDVIGSQIEPSPLDLVYCEIRTIEALPVVVINVKRGSAPIYCIKKYGFSGLGCPIRVGSTCREMSQEQINNRFKMRFYNDDLLVNSPTNLRELSFLTLKNYYSNMGYKLNDYSFETNLKLINDKGMYNVMAELLSDNNRFSFIFVKFEGLNKASLSQRSDYGNKSILFAYDQMINRLKAENICFSDTSTRPRVDKYLFDMDSVDEAVVNAVAHNDWSIAEPQISFYSNRLEILSHGGLPHNLSKEEFFAGITRPRNAALMKIFSDLDIVDHTGHGIPIIVDHYGREAFDIQDTYILVTIPFNQELLEKTKTNGSQNNNFGVNDIEKDILAELILNPMTSTERMAILIKKSKRTIQRYLKALQNKGYIERVGSSKNTSWKVVK